MNVIEINRTSENFGDYYGVIELYRDEIVMISRAIDKYYKDAEKDDDKQERYMLKNAWNNFRMMTCYGEIDNE